jgi:hypothetical protein
MLVLVVFPLVGRVKYRILAISSLFFFHFWMHARPKMEAVFFFANRREFVAGR